MKTVTIEVPLATARDFVAPYVFDAPIEPRRKDALDEIDQLIRDALATREAPLLVPVQTFTLKAIASDLQGHIGHRVSVRTEDGVVTGLRCEDCDTVVDTEPS